jgi:hypothetical protein
MVEGATPLIVFGAVCGFNPVKDLQSLRKWVNDTLYPHSSVLNVVFRVVINQRLHNPGQICVLLKNKKQRGAVFQIN